MSGSSGHGDKPDEEDESIGTSSSGTSSDLDAAASSESHSSESHSSEAHSSLIPNAGSPCGGSPGGESPFSGTSSGGSPCGGTSSGGCPCSESPCNGMAQIMPDWKNVFVKREEFLKLLSITLSGFIALLATVPALAFVFTYLFKPEHRDWVKVGPIEKYKEGETVGVVFLDPYRLPWDAISGRRTAWLRREPNNNFMAFAINCTHLGCPVRWEAGAELFMCPCHGGVFYSNGEVAAGPPPRPMHRYPVRIANGQVEISVGSVLEEKG